MDIQVSVAIIGVAAALLGSLIGGVSSYFSTRSMRRLEWKMSRLDREIDKAEALYAEFLSHTNLAMIAVVDKSQDPMALVRSMVITESRIRLVSPELGDLARKIVGCVMDQHRDEKKPEPPRYPALRDEFIEKCRASIAAMRAAV